jgi:hypothetical protein
MEFTELLQQKGLLYLPQVLHFSWKKTRVTNCFFPLDGMPILKKKISSVEKSPFYPKLSV